MIFIVNQVYIFLYAILGGIIVAFLYDVLRIKRRAIRTSVIIVSLEDILYWVVAAVFLFVTVYKSNSGEMRGYIFIGNVIGVILYESLFSKIIINSSVMVINLIKRIIVFICKILSYPFKLIFKILKVPISFIFKHIIKFAKISLKETKSISGKASGFTRRRIKRIASLSKKIRKARKST
ncbi:MAG: spore cortex biosynthesis protein YabQ [Ruminiclostridium sp.]